jgi:hypothetical protein
LVIFYLILFLFYFFAWQLGRIGLHESEFGNVFSHRKKCNFQFHLIISLPPRHLEQPSLISNGPRATAP